MDNSVAPSESEETTLFLVAGELVAGVSLLSFNDCFGTALLVALIEGMSFLAVGREGFIDFDEDIFFEKPAGVPSDETVLLAVTDEDVEDTVVPVDFKDCLVVEDGMLFFAVDNEGVAGFEEAFADDLGRVLGDTGVVSTFSVDFKDCFVVGDGRAASFLVVENEEFVDFEEIFEEAFADELGGVLGNEGTEGTFLFDFKDFVVVGGDSAFFSAVDKEGLTVFEEILVDELGGLPGDDEGVTGAIPTSLVGLFGEDCRDFRSLADELLVACILVRFPSTCFLLEFEDEARELARSLVRDLFPLGVDEDEGEGPVTLI